MIDAINLFVFTFPSFFFSLLFFLLFFSFFLFSSFCLFYKAIEKEINIHNGSRDDSQGKESSNSTDGDGPGEPPSKRQRRGVEDSSSVCGACAADNLEVCVKCNVGRSGRITNAMKEGDTNTAKAMERHQNLYLHGHVDVPGILRQPGTYFYQQQQ